MSVELGIRDLRERVDQSVALCAYTVKLGNPRLCYLKSLCETNDVRKVLGTASLATLLSAAVDKVNERDAVSYIKKTDALGGVDLVSRERKHINTECCEVDLHVTDSLNGIGEHKCALRVSDLCYLGDGLKCADLIVRVHNRNESGLIGYCLAKLVELYNSVCIDADVGNAEALALERGAGVKNGVCSIALVTM